MDGGIHLGSLPLGSRLLLGLPASLFLPGPGLAVLLRWGRIASLVRNHQVPGFRLILRSCIGSCLPGSRLALLGRLTGPGGVLSTLSGSPRYYHNRSHCSSHRQTCSRQAATQLAFSSLQPRIRSIFPWHPISSSLFPHGSSSMPPLPVYSTTLLHRDTSLIPGKISANRRPFSDWVPTFLRLGADPSPARSLPPGAYDVTNSPK